MGWLDISVGGGMAYVRGDPLPGRLPKVWVSNGLDLRLRLLRVIYGDWRERVKPGNLGRPVGMASVSQGETYFRHVWPRVHREGWATRWSGCGELISVRMLLMNMAWNA